MVGHFSISSFVLLYDLSLILISFPNSFQETHILDSDSLKNVPGNLRAIKLTLVNHQESTKQNLFRFWIGRYQPGGNKASILMVG